MCEKAHRGLTSNRIENMRDKAKKKIGALLEMIKYQHSLHTLPFVYLGVCLANKTIPGWGRLGWITLGMISARSLAMGLNRYIDRKIDARNPRTAGRPLPKGLISENECLLCCAVSALLCLVSAWHLPLLVWVLAPVVLFLFILYPHTKRFTWTCHFWLGLTMAFAPLGGWVAVSNTVSPAVLLLMMAVFSLIAGSDLVYSCQDIEVDRREGLYSIPSKFGAAKALRITKVLHSLSFASFAALGFALDLHPAYFIGVGLAAVLAFRQSLTLKPESLSPVGQFINEAARESSSQPASLVANQAFLAMNGFVSVVVLLFALPSL